MQTEMDSNITSTKGAADLSQLSCFTINPLFQYADQEETESNDDTSTNKPQRQVLNSIVTPVPVSYNIGDDKTGNCSDCGEIKISFEEYCQNGVPLFRRVAVRTHGPYSREEAVTHATFSIPIEPLPRQGISWICWAEFESKLYLCVLSGPTTLRIFDVYPTSSSCTSSSSEPPSIIGGGEGHTISLPFEASGIFSLSTHGDSPSGLLIERQCRTVDVDLKKTTMDSGSSYMANDENIIEPPSTLRIGIDAKQFHPRQSTTLPFSPDSSCSSDSDVGPMVSGRVVSGHDDMPSLCTLHHPLDEIRPCLFMPKNKIDRKDLVWRKNLVHFCNDLEHVVFVGKPRCFVDVLTDSIVVTYNKSQRCHRIWILNEAPPPPETIPLWKLSAGNSNLDFATAASFTSSNATVAMTCIHTLDGTNEAIRVFLSTDPRSRGDFILSLLVKGEINEDDNIIQDDGNVHTLKCVELYPLEDSENGKISWTVCDEYSLSCLSAVPIEATNIDLKPFNIVADGGTANSQHIFLRNNYGRRVPRAIGILACQRDGRIVLYRGNMKLTDITIPMPQNVLTTVIGLDNPVYNRADVIVKRSNARKRIKVSCSLTSTFSQVTELALSAIGSSMLNSSSDDCIGLYFSIRADSCTLAQIRSSLACTNDDVEWESFSLITLSLLIAATGGVIDDKCIMTNSRQAVEDSEEPWLTLLQSSFHADYMSRNACKLITLTSDRKEMKRDKRFKTSCLSEKEKEFILGCKCLSLVKQKNEKSHISEMIFDALHMLYEDAKIKRAASSSRAPSLVAEFLFNICRKCHSGDESLMSDFESHYLRDFPELKYKKDGVLRSVLGVIPKRLAVSSQPLCLFSSLENIIKFGSQSSPIYSATSRINGVCKSSYVLLQLYYIMFGSHSQCTTTSTDRKVVMALIQADFATVSDILNSFSSALALPLMDTLYRCRLNPPPLDGSWPATAFELIGRNDLAQIKLNLKPMGSEDSTLISSTFQADDPDHDGLVSIEKYSAMFFPNDTRIHEAAKLLRSSKPLFLRVNRGPEVHDHDFERLKQQKLALLCRRILPLPVGRGMLTIGTLDCIPVEPLAGPKICLAGRVHPQNVIVNLEENRCTSKHKMWPDFHNGVANGLRLPMAVKGEQTINRTWIVSNRPKTSQAPPSQPNELPPSPEPDHTYGGLLFALGLRGHLAALDKTDIVEFINKGPLTTAVGMMLGFAANKRGSCDVTIFKTLCVHIPSLLPTSFRSVDLSSSIQCAAVAGVGLLCQGSAHRLLTEFLLNEIGKRPVADQNIDDRESYSLTCGISLGMVNLCLANIAKTSVNDGLSDLNIEERLHKYIIGGVDDTFERQRQNTAERGSNNDNIESEKSSRVYEGPMINTDITSPGATLALGMIFHRSGSKPAASLVELPETLFELNGVRPDFLFLRVVSKSLILWDKIQPSLQWINAQIPGIILKYYSLFKRKAEKLSGLGDLAKYFVKKATQNKDNDGKIKGFSNNDDEDDEQKSHAHADMEEDIDIDLDYSLIRQAYAYITAGICFSLGLRYAGTGNEQAMEAIYEKVLELKKLRDGADPVSLALQPDVSTLELCLGSSAISLAMVMAGTGDLRVFRLLKALRWKCDMDVKYGNHMAYASALGLLFLGGGSCTLGNEPPDVAALIASFFPRFPVYTHDNRYHLQALRHLYALAVKERKVEAIDVDSKEKILLPLKFDFGEGHVDNAMSPILLLNKGTKCTITIDSNRYYPAEVQLKDLVGFNSTLSLYVKKRAGKLSYMQDTLGQNSFFSQLESGRGEVHEFIKSFIEERQIIAFAKYMCDNESKTNSKNLESNALSLSSNCDIDSFCLSAIQKCLKDEITDAVMIYLTLYDQVSNLEKKSWPSRTMWELRILRSCYSCSNKLAILDPHFVALLCEAIDKKFAKINRSKSNISKWDGPSLIWNA